MNKALIFHADPAHGWLEVNRADLEALNIAHKISRCSYQKSRPRIFGRGLRCRPLSPRRWQRGWNITTTEKYTNANSFIRNLPRFETGF